MPPRRLISDKIVIKEASGFSYSDNVGIGTTVVTANFQVFKSGNTDAFRIQSETQTSFIVDNNGNVGIGMAQPGEWKLNVEGASRFFSTNTSNLDITVVSQDPNATPPMRIATSATPLFTISPSGNVGIGTAQTGTNTLRVLGSTDSTGGYTVGDTTVVNASGNIPSADRLPVVTVAKGGTGQTNLSANKLMVGNATTAVLTPANLHWDNANNRLGIGTATPMQTFNVFGNALIDGILTASNLTVLGDFTTLNTLTSNTEQMVINNAGTGPALIVRQSGAQPVAEFFDVESGTALHIANNGNVGIGTTTVTQALQVQGNISLSGGNRFIGTPTANTLSLRTNNTDQVTLDANGNVGIGTNIPLAELHVLQTGTAPAFRVDDVANDTTPFLIDASGNVGIASATPGTPLDVSGVARATTFTSTQATGTAPLTVASTTVVTNLNADLLDGQQGSYYLDMGNASAGTLAVGRGGTGQTTLTANKVVVGNGTTGVLTPTNLHWDNTNSRLGIGTGNPQLQFSCFGSSGLLGQFITSTVNKSSYIGFNNTNGGTVYIGLDGDGLCDIERGSLVLGTWTNNSIIFMTGSSPNTEKVRITSSGSVGIGTTNPQSTLHVQGNGLFTGYVKQNGIPAFYATRALGNLTVSSSVITIIWDNKRLDNTNSYNNSTGIFTVPVSGVYVFSVFGMTSAVGTIIYMDILVNGIQKGCDPYSNTVSTGVAAGQHQNASGTAIYQLSVNDQVSVRLWSGTFYGFNHNGFCGYLIG